jgi:hypothetical protein
MSAASVQNWEFAAPPVLWDGLELGASLELELEDAELPSSDPVHAESRTTAAATDSPVRHAVRVRRMDRG